MSDKTNPDAPVTKGDEVEAKATTKAAPKRLDPKYRAAIRVAGLSGEYGYPLKADQVAGLAAAGSDESAIAAACEENNIRARGGQRVSADHVRLYVRTLRAIEDPENDDEGDAGGE